jgi:hypothetical protein
LPYLARGPGRPVWRVYSRPTDILRSEEVRVTREPTLDALELRLGWAVALIHAAAGETGAAGIPGIDGDERKPRVAALVGQEEAQLMERPGRENGLLLLGSRDPGAGCPLGGWVRSSTATPRPVSLAAVTICLLMQWLT